jgi:hypothetical protein
VNTEIKHKVEKPSEGRYANENRERVDTGASAREMDMGGKTRMDKTLSSNDLQWQWKRWWSSSCTKLIRDIML